MAIFGAFASSTLGMISQSHAFATISTNVANINTGGYKATETRFATLLSNTIRTGPDGDSRLNSGPYLESGLGGVRPRDTNLISKQGNIITSSNPLDVAINGQGFFILNSKFDGSGDTLYTRDGGFSLKNEGTFSTTGIPLSDGTATTLTLSKGFLADKNGFFVQGQVASNTGVFSGVSASGPVRLDQFAFFDQFTPTTTAELVLNLPGDDPNSLPQIDTVSLSGTPEAGDTYSVTVDGTKVTYTATGTEAGISQIRDNLVAAINANTTVSAVVTAAALPAGNDFKLTAAKVNTPFVLTPEAKNGGVTNDSAATSANIQGATSPTDVQSFGANITDSAGTKQPIQFNFTKLGTGIWEMAATTSRTPIAQVDTVTLTGLVEAGDVYTVTVDGVQTSYTATGLEGSLSTVRNNLVQAINGNALVNGKVTAAATGTGGLTLTADNPGVSYTATTSTVDGGPKTAQVDTVTIAGTVEAGDKYSTTVDGTTVTITVTTEITLAQVRDTLRAAINADSTVGPLVTAANGAGAGDITLTAATAGTPFIATAATTNGGVTADNAATSTNTTANVSSNLNTIALVNTTPNGPSTFTTAATTITFDSNGLLTSPTSITFPLTFEGGTTATVAVDISKMTQFAGAFSPTSFEQDGFAKAEIKSLSFNADGVISGNFGDGTTRNLYRIPLAIFSNPNALDRANGNTFATSEASGAARVVSAADSGLASFLPNSHELSNVDLAAEFTNMIITQKAYNSSATVFRTVDELIQTARDLKR